MSEDGSAGLLALPGELLAQVLQHCGARAVARAATGCHRLHKAKQALAGRAAFASAMALFSSPERALEEATAACEAALDGIPATVDFALVFLANCSSLRPDPTRPVLDCIARRLPPGTKVVGCSGRGIFGVLPDGTAAEVDPCSSQAGVSVLVGRVPGAHVHAFAAKRQEGGWASEAACREWMGLGAGLSPVSLALFTKSSCTHLLEQCLDGMQTAFPGMVVTGGVASGPRRREVVCLRVPLPPSQAASDQALAPAATANDAADKQYVGLVLCAPSPEAGAEQAGPEGGGGGGGGAMAQPGCRVRAGALTVKGLVGVDPVFHALHLVKEPGHYFVDPQGQEVELVAVVGAQVRGVPCMEALANMVEAHGHADLALWAANELGRERYASAIAGGGLEGVEVVVLEAMSHQQGVLGAVHASQREAFDRVLRDAQRPNRTLCAQVLALGQEGQGYIRDIKAHVPTLVVSGGDAAGGWPYHTSGMVVVSCTAKGSGIYKAEGAEAKQLQEVAKVPMAGVYCDGEIGPHTQGPHCGIRWGGSGGEGAEQGGTTSRSELVGFTTVVSVFNGV